MRTPRTSSALTGRSSGSSSGERSGSAGGWVSPRPSSTEPPRNSSPPTTATVRTKTTASSTGDLRLFPRRDSAPRSAPRSLALAAMLPRLSSRVAGLVVDREVGGQGPHPAAVVTGLPRLLRQLDDPHDLVDVVGDREQVQVGVRS